MLSPHSPKQNRLLAALPAADCERLYPHLERVPLSLGSVIYESDRLLDGIAIAGRSA